MSSKDTSFAKKPRAIKCGDRFIDFEKPQIMGVLNLTPDSFYDGGKYNQEKQRAFRVEQMLKEGATIIDIGAVSTRPGAKIISVEEEIERIVWPLERLVKLFPEAFFFDRYLSFKSSEGMYRRRSAYHKRYFRGKL